MLRLGVGCLVVAGLLALPLVFVNSEEAIRAWLLASISVAGLGAFFLFMLLLQRIAPAQKEEDRTYFNARAPGRPGRPVKPRP